MTTAHTAIHILLNGEAREMAGGTTVSDVLREMNLNPEKPRGIAVAVNDEVVPKADWETAMLADGDRVEVITARQGG